MALSKKTRFEVFKRDGFTCQYCGRTPPTVILEVDHIDPKANGGSDNTINLITSCFDCNRGKSDVKLGDIHPRPDADIKYLKAQQEIVEAKRYLETQNELDQLRIRMAARITRVWLDSVTEYSDLQKHHVYGWLNMYSPEEIEYAIRKAGFKYKSDHFGSQNHFGSEVQAIRYASAIMRNVKKEAEEGG